VGLKAAIRPPDISKTIFIYQLDIILTLDIQSTYAGTFSSKNSANNTFSFIIKIHINPYCGYIFQYIPFIRYAFVFKKEQTLKSFLNKHKDFEDYYDI
jgi:hypothetical protein